MRYIGALKAGIVILFGLYCLAEEAVAQDPISLRANISISSVIESVDAVRMAYDPITDTILLMSMNGGISAFDPRNEGNSVTPYITASDHGLSLPATGFAIASDGSLFLVGNNFDSYPGYNVGMVRRGVPNGSGGYVWKTVFETEPYPRSGTYYDHNMNGIVVSPDNQFLFINSGSRTDHGELQDNNGLFPGLREAPLTSAILRVPFDSEDLVLQNDSTFLAERGFLYADGVRNSYSLAFDAEGRLYGTENSGDRDDNEELNLLLEGGHYGFPWRLGQSDTPMRFDGYQPNSDLLINPQAGSFQDGGFYNDPNYPAAPTGVQFIDGVQNLGPDADLYRDPSSGQILDASEQASALATFTSHRSPLGLVFDTSNELPAPYKGDSFVLSWTGDESPLLAPFTGEGEDLLHVEFVDDGTGGTIHARRIVSNFINPVDAVLVDNSLYVLEYGGNSSIWKVQFNDSVGVEEDVPATKFGVEVFPNPVSDRINIKVKGAASDRIEVQLVDVRGRTILSLFEGNLSQGSLEFSRQLPVHLSAGVYMLLVTGPSSGSQTQKVIVL